MSETNKKTVKLKLPDGVSLPEGIELPEIEVSKATIRETVVGSFKFSYVQPKPNLPQPLIKCVGKINLGRRDNLVVFNEFNILFKNEDEAIKFLKVIVVCANHVKIGAEKLDESIEEVAL